MSARRSGLGRGLDALIPAGPVGERAYASLSIDAIVPNPQQPRTVFDDQSLDALSESVAEVGLLQPVTVRPSEDEPDIYVLVAGERRWRAARRAGLNEIPAMIRQVDEVGSLTQALVENLQREDLTPLEEAAAYQHLLEDYGMTHDEVAHRVGRARTTITNTLRLLQLPAPIQGMLERGDITAGHARALVGLEDRAFAEHIAHRAAEEGWSVRQVEDAVRSRRGKEEQERRPTIREIRPVAIIELEQRLTEQLGTRVNIRYRNEKGRVEIGFGSLDDLERLYRQFFS